MLVGQAVHEAQLGILTGLGEVLNRRVALNPKGLGFRVEG